jgi:glycosyltransferase involved in cell wall biosynthesis
MPQTKPYISVIIITYNRKEFILKAIKSVIKQTLPRQYYEIIVVKNIKDKEIDTFCKKNRITKILVNEQLTSGKYLHIGISKSKGEIVCFLEDDDLFDKKKLEIILNEFKKNKDLIYYHNAYDIINSEGKKISAEHSNFSGRTITTKELQRYLPELISNGIADNVSSISIRKSLFNNLDKLYNSEVKVQTDNLLFFLSTDNNKMQIIDPTILTNYRKHNVSTKGGATTTHDINTLEKFRTEFSRGTEITINDLKEIYKQVSNPVCKECLFYLITSKKLSTYLTDKKQAQKIGIKEFTSYIIYVLRSRHKLNNILLSSLFLAAKIAPNTTLKFYYNRYMKKYQVGR